MKRYIPLLALLALMGLAWYFRPDLSFEDLKEQRHELLAFGRKHPIASPMIFMAVYILSTAFSIPAGSFLSVAAGFLFGQPLAMLLVLFGATLGASIIFLAAKTALGKTLKENAGPKINKMREGFSQDAANYMLFLRLAPIFPFWLVNLAPAFFGVGFFTFFWTTFLGIIPGVFVFTQAGVGLGAIFDQNQNFSLEAIFNFQVKVALIALGFFAILPVIVKRWRQKK